MEITDLDIENLKGTFIDLLKSTKREGIDNLISFIEKTDFFRAPASTRFHSSYKGGLLVHSLNVYECLLEQISIPVFKEKIKDIGEDSCILCALLHDICKACYYAEDTRNVKDKETGKWHTEPYYTVDDKIPYGHGEKSVMMIEEFIKLKPVERYTIRWHMGYTEPKEHYNTLGLAYEKYPFALALHMADLEATHLKEVEGD